ncbi:serine hydrolase domain-containing protein [Altibacter sp.]|uniref:serine hydrolase domain-containing protein n=1 Tax=Altibacter sp. TaxID=2024823 RepID=UPI000C956480|nr:serine hydrolase domain-containing protein [Altibacter sp.]MAP54462.1 hypothetical protein [Altibacter sp.]
MKFSIYGFFLISCLSWGQSKVVSTLSQSKLDTSGPQPVHGILLHIEDPAKHLVYSKSFGKTLDGKRDLLPEDSFRIASTTKLFVAVSTLQLVEEGKLTLDHPFLAYLPETKSKPLQSLHTFRDTVLTHTITVQQLLSHRSGLADIFTDAEEAFIAHVLSNPKRQYTPQSILALFFDFQLHTKPHFAPGNGWHYSDMNYVLLGLLLEHLEQKSLSEIIRSRIIEPLGMHATYFEFYEPPVPLESRVAQYVGTLNFSEINTSFDWAGGGLVSTNGDLAVFIKALFQGQLLSEASIEAMIDVHPTQENESLYGLGIYRTSYNDEYYFGHYGYYGTFVGYAPATGRVLSYCITQAEPPFNVYNYISEVLSNYD